jgi:hypothetical protein
MVKLERLTQDEDGTLHFYNKDGKEPSWVQRTFFEPAGKIRTLVVRNPCLDISREIEKMAESNSLSIPKMAEYYTASEFSGDTQHVRKNEITGEEGMYLVYAVQFYWANIIPCI